MNADWDDTEEAVEPVAPTKPVKLTEPEQRELKYMLGDRAVSKATDARTKKLAALMRKLPMRHKLLMKYLVANQMHPRRARAAMERDGVNPPDQTTLYRWMRRREFQEGMQAYGDLLLQSSGAASPVSILTRIDEVVEDALRPVPRIHNGQQVYDALGNPLYEVDRKSALKGLELLGKTPGTKLFKGEEAQGARVTVFLDFGGGQMKNAERETETVEGDVLEGEFTESGP